jgi:broad specificity phosphatase PhoE
MKPWQSDMEILFETHATSLDNEAGLASGHFDVDLSERGTQQAAALGERRRAGDVETIYVSHLRRSWRTADIAFGGTAVPIVRDARLAECDYGGMTRRPAEEMAAARDRFVTTRYPGGESYEDVTARVASWLADVRNRHRRRILVIGHRGTHFALDHLLRGIPLADAVRMPLVWQPGWIYEVNAV